VLALDVPSGLELASGEVRAPHVAAEATMTLAAPKTALKAPGAAGAAGRLFLADISVPGLVYERLGLRWQTPFARGPVVELDTRVGDAIGSPSFDLPGRVLIRIGEGSGVNGGD
jgi:NAD(P)H-hydrate epimerase